VIYYTVPKIKKTGFEGLGSNRMKTIFLVTLFIAVANLATAEDQDNIAAETLSLEYTNPLWDGYLADPHVLRANGVYYAYGTGKTPDGKQFPILKSKDFCTWEFVGGAIAPLKEPVLKDYWAPEVIQRGDKFYLYYAGNLKMRVAVADQPEGPFEDSGKLLFPELEFSIDGHPYHDPVSKKWYLFYAKDFFDQRPGTALAVIELADDMISTRGPDHTVIRPFSDWQIYERNRHWYDKDWPAWHTVEGAAVAYKNGKYYCFYSGGNWQTPGYGVGCGVSDSITGPYLDPWSETGASVLRSIEGKLIGPGHNSVILGPDNETFFIVYHSWNAKRTKRQMSMDPIVWTTGGPKVYQPSTGKKKMTIPLSEEAQHDYENSK
jgi:beta-xylosidase